MTWEESYATMEMVRACGNCGMAVVKRPPYDKTKPNGWLHIVTVESRQGDYDEMRGEASCPTRKAVVNLEVAKPDHSECVHASGVCVYGNRGGAARIHRCPNCGEANRSGKCACSKKADANGRPPA